MQHSASHPNRDFVSVHDGAADGDGFTAAKDLGDGQGYPGAQGSSDGDGSAGAKRREGTRRVDDRSFGFLAEMLPHIVWTATPDGSIDYINQHWYAYTGQFPGDALGQGWHNAIHPDDLPATLRAWERANATGIAEAVEHRIRSASGEYRLHVTRYAPQVDENGTIVRWFGTSSDVQDDRERDARASESEKRTAVSDLAHKLAHGLNNPLAALTNLVYIARSQAESPESKQLIEQAEQQIERIADLVHKILVMENSSSAQNGKPRR